MNWPRVKWLLIAMLLAGNFLLLGLYVQRRVDADRSVRQESAAMENLLAGQGVTLSPEARAGLLLSAPRLYVRRDDEREGLLAALWLGSAERTEQGGRIVTYESPAGWAQFRGGGQFQVEWNPPRPPEGTPEEDAAALLAGAGFSSETAPVVRRTGADVEVTLSQRVNGLPVFGSSVRLRYGAEGLLSLDGQWLWDKALPVIGEADCPALGGALLRFADRMRLAGTPVSAVEEARLGYLLSVASADYVSLNPVWRLTCDGQVFYMDPRTGETVAQTTEERE
ncbi:MAG: hypothetical protein LBT60_06880 [Oscillospiraceae bacterium]|jgi:hypothetical protein|nr:hypothetical protein [Oscillospiraceae bacterium]